MLTETRTDLIFFIISLMNMLHFRSYSLLRTHLGIK